MRHRAKTYHVVSRLETGDDPEASRVRDLQAEGGED
jgi:hypothetical protein